MNIDSLTSRPRPPSSYTEVLDRLEAIQDGESEAVSQSILPHQIAELPRKEGFGRFMFARPQ